MEQLKCTECNEPYEPASPGADVRCINCGNHQNVQGRTMEDKECVICGCEVIGYGNNAMPVSEGRCCNLCNTSEVIPERLMRIEKGRANGKAKMEDA